MPYIKHATVEDFERLSKQVSDLMGPGRTYYNTSYDHATGADWIGMVESVVNGETEITAEEFEAIRLAHLEANIPIEIAAVDAEIARINAIPIITNAQRRARVQEVEDAIADAEDTPEAKQAAINAVLAKQGAGLTRQEQAAAIGAQNARRIEVAAWRASTPDITAVTEQIVAAALNPENEHMTIARATALVGAAALDGATAAALDGARESSGTVHEEYDVDGTLVRSWVEGG